MEEEKQEEGFIPPPTADEVAPEPKVPGRNNKHKYIILALISILIIVIGAVTITLTNNNSTNELDEIAWTDKIYTNTMLCGDVEDDEGDIDACEMRSGNIFEKGESVWVITRIIPNTDEDIDVDMSFTTDIYSPNGEVTENFLGGHDLKKTLTDGQYSEYWIEITTSQEDIYGKYDVVLTLKDNIQGEEEIIEAQFTLA